MASSSSAWPSVLVKKGGTVVQRLIGDLSFNFLQHVSVGQARKFPCNKAIWNGQKCHGVILSPLIRAVCCVNSLECGC